MNGKGIDIGWEGDKDHQNHSDYMGIRKWRWNTFMAGKVKDETYDFVYSSHTLEHINDSYTLHLKIGLEF